MRLHIVGSGPTGMSIAWEALRHTEHEVTIYDSKPSGGGSWWEPEIEERDLHSHRAVFKNAFVNTNSIFKEMGIEWNEIFVKEKNSVYGALFASMGPKDYWALTSLAARVLACPDKYREVTLKEALGPMTRLGQRFVETTSFHMDGVDWDTLSAFEFVQSFNHVGLSIPETQRVSGKVMSDAMQEALEAEGARFVFGTALKDVDYRYDGFTATFSNGTKVNDGLLILCADHNAAAKLIKGNWGPSAHDTLADSAYECINVLIDYEEPTEFKNAMKRAMDSEWTILPEMLEGGKTLSCVLCNLTEEILTMKPDVLKMRVMEQLRVPPAVSNVRIGWGADWDGIRWRFSQSSGVLSTRGQIPFYGKSSRVAMCGMMSHRHTPYASIEAATEVGRMFCHATFGTRPPLRPFLVTEAMMLFIVFSLILIIQQ
jgi:hypothetical protein